MDDYQQIGGTGKESIIAGILGAVSFIGGLIWSIFVHFASMVGGQGDGSSSVMSRGWYEFGYSGSVYLGLVFLSCLPFVRGETFTIVGVIAHLVFLCLAIYLISQRGGIVLLLPFLAVAGGWIMLFKSKQGKPPPTGTQD